MSWWPVCGSKRARLPVTFIYLAACVARPLVLSLNVKFLSPTLCLCLVPLLLSHCHLSALCLTFPCVSVTLLLSAWQCGTCQSQWRTWGPMPFLSLLVWPQTSTLEVLSWSWWKRHVGYYWLLRKKFKKSRSLCCIIPQVFIYIRTSSNTVAKVPYKCKFCPMFKPF